MLPEQIAQRFALPVPFVENVLAGNVEEMVARSRESYSVPSNGETPEHAFTLYPRFTPRVMDLSDTLNCYVDYIDVVDPREVIPSEPEDNIRNHPSFARYVEWYKAGFIPPPPSVFEQIYDGQRKLIGANRRRILTAREAGITRLSVWLGRWNRETGLPLKYGDIINAAA